MTDLVFLAVLFGAACHAGWNALIKVGLDPLATTALIAGGAAVVGIVGLPFAGLPAPAAWPWLAASVVIHLFYFAALVEGYRSGDLGQVYPIARGTAPLMTAGASLVFLGEHLRAIVWGGIVLLAVGVVLLSARGGRDWARLDKRAVGFALLTALTICAYSVVDGVGVRASHHPVSYALVLFVGNALLLMP
jgi:drug/metabolite transporter (DMT)-like permease